MKTQTTKKFKGNIQKSLPYEDQARRFYNLKNIV